MGTVIFLALAGAAEAYLLYVLFHFTIEMKRGLTVKGRSIDGSAEELPQPNVIPLTFVDCTPATFWSAGTWDRALPAVAPSQMRASTPKNWKATHAGNIRRFQTAPLPFRETTELPADIRRSIAEFPRP